MTAYVYRWSLRPQPDMRIELHVEAASATVARREVVHFLERHDGARWPVEAVSRSSVALEGRSPLAPVLAARARRREPHA